MKRVKIGDVFSIPTAKGKAYLHYIERNKDGDLIRVLPGLFTEDCSDLEALVTGKELFYVGFAVKAAYRLGIVAYEGHVDASAYTTPEYMRDYDIFKNEQGEYEMCIVHVPTLKRQNITELTPEILALSPFGSWNDTLLIERLEAGWNLENWRD